MSEDFRAEISASFGPVISLFSQDCTDETDDRIAGGEMPTESLRRRISLFSRSVELFDQIWTHTSSGTL